MTSLFDPWAKSRAQRSRLKKSIFEPTPPEEEEQKKPTDSLWQGSDADQDDRGAHRAGLPDRPWSELPGAIMTGLSVLGGGLPAAATVGMKAANFDPLRDLFGIDLFGAGTPALGGGLSKGGMADDLAAFSGDPMSPGGGWSSGGMADDMAAFGGVDPRTGDPGIAGLYSNGGKVQPESLFAGDPPGPDNVIIGAKTGERILNEEQYASLSPEAKAEVDAALKAKKK